MDTFSVPAIYVASQGPLILLACKLSRGVAVSMGAGVTHVTPVYDRQPITFTSVPEVLRSNTLTGNTLTDYLATLLTERGHYGFDDTSSGRRILAEMKEALCYVASDFQAELDKSKKDPASIEKSFTLPDESTITLGDERFRCAEALFKPYLMGLDEILGIHEMVYRSIMKCPIQNRRELFGNIVLAG